MFCKECGTKIPDNAQFCPYCGEVLEIPVEINDLGNKLEDDFNIHLDWVTETKILTQRMRTNINVQVAKITSAPVYGAKVQLSGPPQVDIIVKSRKINPKKAINKIFFPISAKEAGDFTLTATLTSNAGHRITFPFQIRVEPSKTLYRGETHYPDERPAITATHSTPTRSTSEDLVAARIIFGIIGIVLLFVGITVTTSGGYGSNLPLGITLAIIGVVILMIASGGACCYAGGGCGNCDCGDCDCGDCDC